MKKFSFKAVALAAGLLAGGSAFAVVDFEAATPAPVKFASELVISGGGTALANNTNALNFTAKIGVTAAASTTRYVRVDLSSGVFTANPTLSIAATGGAGAATLTGTLTSGGTGSGYAVFSFSTNAAANPGDNLAATDVATVGVTTGVTAVSQADITARVRVFSIPAFADAPTESNFLYSKVGTLLKFAPALKFEATNPTLTATYEKSFFDFTATNVGAASDLGVLTITDAQAKKADGTNALVGDILADKIVVTVNGDFSFMKSDTNGLIKTGLTLGGTAATTLTATKATYGTTSAGFGAPTAAATTLSMIADSITGTIAIPAGSYTADLALTANTGYTISNQSGLKIGTIVRNGTTLVAPLTNQPTGWYSRLVLTNNGNTPLAYRVAALAESGVTVALTGAAASGSVAANSTTVVDMPALTTITGAKRTGLVVTVDGADTAVTGQYQIVEPTGVSISNYTLVVKK